MSTKLSEHNVTTSLTNAQRLESSAEIHEQPGEDSSKKRPPEPTRHPLIIYTLALSATIGGLLFGYDTGIMSGAILLIAEEYSLDSLWIQAIVASTVAVATLFSLLAGVVSDCIGRKPTIMIAAVIFTVGGVLMGTASGPVMIVIGRAVVGISIGVVSSVVPVYVSECAPKSIRGMLITLNQLFITFGIVSAALLAAGFSEVEHGWRYMLGLAAIPGVIQFVFFMGLPESPRYQILKNQEAKAIVTLKKIRATDDVNFEVEDIKRAVEEERQNTGFRVWKKIFTTKQVRKALFIGCMLQLFQQLCGINTVIYYSATILNSAGFDKKNAIWLACLPAIVNFIFTFPGLWAVESLGRKLVLVISFFAVAGSLVVLAVGFFMAQTNSPLADATFESVKIPPPCGEYENCYKCTSNNKCGYCFLMTDKGKPREASCVEVNRTKVSRALQGRCSRLENETDQNADDENLQLTWLYCPSEYAFLTIAGLMFFVAAFAPGAGPMPWTINAEIYPLWSRSVANSIATTTNWASNSIVSATFLTISQKATQWGAFLIFCVFSVLGAIFVLIMVPETKDKSLEDIELLFMSKAARQEVLQRRASQEEEKEEEEEKKETRESVMGT